MNVSHKRSHSIRFHLYEMPRTGESRDRTYVSGSQGQVQEDGGGGQPVVGGFSLG